ncbi:MAG: hypothetical protein JW384_03809 [Nitrosomonadaceae bacterium]|nr:hypothetical protein [Nitrosomonadaceae bacterium]
MLSIVCGFSTAIIFAIGTLASARSSRTLGAPQVVAWSSLVGLVLVGPFVLRDGIPTNLDRNAWLLLAIAGVGNVLGFTSVFLALRVGKVGVVSPIVATQGVFAAVLAAVGGKSIEPLIAFVLLAIVVGIIIAAKSRDPAPIPNENNLRAALFASAGATFFGLSLFAVGMLSGLFPLAWLLLPGRAVGVLALAVPLIVASRLRVTKATAPLLALVGICDIAGITMYAIGAQQNIAVTAVVASQMAPMAAVLAYFIFGERLGKGQIVGLVVILSGVTVLSFLQ